MVETASWCLREKRKGECPAVEHEGDATEQQEAPWYVSKRKHRLSFALWTRDMTPKTQFISEAHLLTVCGGETKEELLTAAGK